MPRFAFTGFDTGANVALSVTQDGLTRSGSVSAWGTDVAGISISARTAPVVTNPAAVWLEATNPSGFGVSDPGITGYNAFHHDVFYIWTVRGNPLSPFTAPVNLAPGWNDPNVAYGPKVVFAFPDIGDYTVDLWCVSMENGATATAEYSVTVQDADTVYAGAKTICFSDEPGETWADEKPGCVRATTYGEIDAALRAATTPPRLLHKRGSDTDVLSSLLQLEENHLIAEWGAWGTGPKPILRMIDTLLLKFRDITNTQFTITDLDFRGDWDAQGETGGSAEPFQLKGNLSPTSFYFIWNCDFDGYEAIYPDVNIGSDFPTIFGNCKIGGFRNYGFLVGKDGIDRIAIVGCDVASHPDAMHGGPKIGSINNNHGPVRLDGDVQNAYIAMSSFFSRSGWSGGNGNLADQPCLRLNSGGDGGLYRYLDRVCCEGGNSLIVMDGATTERLENPGTYIFDKFLGIASAKTGSRKMISPQMGGFHMRNAYLFYPDVPAAHDGSGWAGAVDMDVDNQVADNLASPMRLHHTTFFTPISAANAPSVDMGAILRNEGGFLDVTEENNVSHSPNTDTPRTVDGPLDVTTPLAGVTPRFKGRRYNYLPATGSLTATIGIGQSFVVPYSAITSDTQLVRGTSATSRAYWQTHENTDVRHMMVMGGRNYRAQQGDFTVSFDASGVTITNTSSRTWEPGDNWYLRLDRTSRLPAMETQFATPALVPLPLPLAGSPAIDSGDSGQRAYDDFFGTVRPASGNERGAFLAP